MNSRTGKRGAAARAKTSAKSAAERPAGASAVTDALGLATSALKSAAGQLAEWVGPVTELSLGVGKAAARCAGGVLRDPLGGGGAGSEPRAHGADRHAAGGSAVRAVAFRSRR